MSFVRTTPILVAAAAAPFASAQISFVTQERSAQTAVSVTSGASDGDFAEAFDYGLFNPALTSLVTGPGGASAGAGAAQSSSFTSTLASGSMSVSSSVQTGSTFVVGESDASSSLLFIFDLAAPTSILFSASGSTSYIGQNPDGEPSDLFGSSRVQLLDSDTLDVIAGFQLGIDAGTDGTNFIGTLDAGRYVILASVSMHAYSADLLGPPPRSGSGSANAAFSLTVVPAPGATVLLGTGVLALGRRRRL